MKKTLLSLLFLSSIGVNAQTTIFEDSFETYTDFAIANVGNWTLTDNDGLIAYGLGTYVYPNKQVAKSFQVFNGTTTSPVLVGSALNNWLARTGNKHMVCFSGIPAGGVTANNDWLISPQITLGTTGNVVSFWAKNCDSTYPERFKVGISSTTSTTGVTALSTGAYVTTPTNITWTQYTYTIPDSFNGQAVYISINCVSNDQYGFAVDDFKVTTTGQMSTADFFAKNFSVFPNPSTGVVNVLSKNNNAIDAIQLTDLNGRVVKNINANGVSDTQINISDLTSGVYFLNVKTEAGSGTTKILKN